MKILTIVGARPQFIKAAAVSRELQKNNNEVLIHTGQHYDYNMSDIFFSELEIPMPKHNLDIGSGFHGEQTGRMLSEIEKVIIENNPDAVMVYGDTNSTLAGALAASKLLVPVIHVEAGLRSYNKVMPEEQNRILTDHISSVLFCPTQTAVSNLRKEGITSEVHFSGDVMYDAVLYSMQIVEKRNIFSRALKSLIGNAVSASDNAIKSIDEKSYYLITLHRAENTNDVKKVKTLIKTLNELDYPVIFPVHPRTAKILLEFDHKYFNNIVFTKPVGYLDMLALTQNSIKVLTDSGGLQKEAYFLNIPCITLRNETEWVETLLDNSNVLCKIDEEDIKNKIVLKQSTNRENNKEYFGDGKAAIHIVNEIERFIKKIC